MPFSIYGLCVPRQCWSDNIDMAGDDHVPDSKLSGLSWRASRFRVKLDRTCGGSSSIKIAIHHTARALSIYFCCKCQIPVSKEAFLV